MSKIYLPYEVMEILKDELPTCFKRGSERTPLAIGITPNVIQHYEGDERFDEKILKLAIQFYCRSKKYLACVLEGAPRIDREGQVVGAVTKSEANYASILLSRRQGNKQKRDLLPTPVPSEEKTTRENTHE